MMDRKERKAGDPFGGAPMKQFEGSQLPAPPKIDEVVAEAETVLQEPETKEERYAGLTCPCGYPYGQCAGMFLVSEDEIFELAYQKKHGSR